MKTSVELKKEKVETAKALGNVTTIKELLDKALDSYIAQQRRLSMLKLLGTGFYGGDLKKMRKR